MRVAEKLDWKGLIQVRPVSVECFVTKMYPRLGAVMVFLGATEDEACLYVGRSLVNLCF
jgi:hypothetical protein